jgi:hypothetical protein
MTNDSDAWLIPLDSWLGVASGDIPHLDLFLKSAEVPLAGLQQDQERASRVKMANSDWATQLWTCISGIAQVSDVVPLIAELAVLEDKRRLKNQALYFVSNIV